MSKTVLIIGDSWGVPNYSKDWPNQSHLDHTEFKLVEKGYNVLNFSLNGGSNIESIEYAKHILLNKPLPESLKSSVNGKRDLYNISGDLKFIPVPEFNGRKIDWIVWFHTESIREIGFSYSNSYCKVNELHVLFSHAIYRAFASLVKLCPKVKTAIIGGQAPIDDILYQYHQPNFIIEDWRSEIVGKKLPKVHTLSRVDLVDSSFDNKDDKLQILNNHSLIYDAMSNTSQFFDRCHPGKPHIELANKLHDVFQQG